MRTLITLLLCAGAGTGQTKLSEAQATLPPVQGYETRWCPAPALSVDTERTAITVGQRWSTATPCYVHFNLTPPAQVDPVSVSSFVESFNITIPATFTGDDEAYIYALAPTFNPIAPAKIGVRVKTAGAVECGACAAGVNVDTRVPRMFPANAVPIGFAVIRGGKFLPQPDEIVTRQQVFIGPGAEMSIRADQGGYWFEVSAVQAAQATAALRTMQLETAKVTAETARVNAMAKSIEAAPTVEQRVTALETYFMQVQGKLPKGKADAQQLQSAYDDAVARVSMQVEGLVNDMQAKSSRMDYELSADMKLVTAPKTAQDSCTFREWAKDAKYIYRCLPDGTWTRYRYDSGWK